MSLWEYRLFWIAMGLAFAVVNAIVTAGAVAAGVVWAAKYLGWSPK